MASLDMIRVIDSKAPITDIKLSKEFLVDGYEIATEENLWSRYESDIIADATLLDVSRLEVITTNKEFTINGNEFFSMRDIYDFIYPVGFQYKQSASVNGIFLVEESPHSLFGFQWMLIHDTQNVFFRSFSILDHTNYRRHRGIQPDMVLNHTHYANAVAHTHPFRETWDSIAIFWSGSDPVTTNAGAQTSSLASISADTSYAGGGETVAINSEVRIYERIS